MSELSQALEPAALKVAPVDLNASKAVFDADQGSPPEESATGITERPMEVPPVEKPMEPAKQGPPSKESAESTEASAENETMPSRDKEPPKDGYQSPSKPKVIKISVNDEMVKDIDDELAYFLLLKKAHLVGVFEKEVYVVRLAFVFRGLYTYPPLLPMANAHPRDGNYERIHAFKLLCLPKGFGVLCHTQFEIQPPFCNKGFYKNAMNLFLEYFQSEAKELRCAFLNHSSMWVVGVVRSRGNWYSQLFAGIVYASSPRKNLLPAAAFVYY